MLEVEINIITVLNCEHHSDARQSGSMTKRWPPKRSFESDESKVGSNEDTINQTFYGLGLKKLDFKSTTKCNLIGSKTIHATLPRDPFQYPILNNF